jgi:hypothetical protein
MGHVVLGLVLYVRHEVLHFVDGGVSSGTRCAVGGVDRHPPLAVRDGAKDIPSPLPPILWRPGRVSPCRTVPPPRPPDRRSPAPDGAAPGQRFLCRRGWWRDRTTSDARQRQSDDHSRTEWWPRSTGRPLPPPRTAAPSPSRCRLRPCCLWPRMAPVSSAHGSRGDRNSPWPATSRRMKRTKTTGRCRQSGGSHGEAGKGQAVPPGSRGCWRVAGPPPSPPTPWPPEPARRRRSAGFWSGGRRSVGRRDGLPPSAGRGREPPDRDRRGAQTPGASPTALASTIEVATDIPPEVGQTA